MDALITAATTQISGLVDSMGPIGIALIGVAAFVLGFVLVKGLLKRGS